MIASTLLLEFVGLIAGLLPAIKAARPPGIDLRERLKPFGWSYEVILAENGSKDDTIKIANELAAKYADPKDGQVRLMSLGEPNYGKALKQGILLARGELDLQAALTSDTRSVWPFVEVLLATHDADGVTELDVKLAKLMDAAAGQG